MKAFCEALEQLYKKVLLGATLENDSHDYVSCLNPARSDEFCSVAPSLEWPNGDEAPAQHPSMVTPVPGAPGRVKSGSDASSTRERLLLQLTVVRVTVTRTWSLQAESHAKEKYREIIKILLQSADIDSTLICMLQNSDKLLSHMAAQCLALLLYFQLREKITLSNSWIAFCQTNLSEYSEGNEITPCLWIITVVMKEIFKDTCSEKTEILKQFLTPLDTTFDVFYNSLFAQHFENHQDPSKIINSLVCFLELLELLITSRIYLMAHFKSQRILFLKPSCVLDVLTWPVPAFVKRKLIVFIKKCLLCKVGEDLCGGPLPTPRPPDRRLEEDMAALASAVLQAVNLGLLETLSAHRTPPCFGGDALSAGPDHVILRAASLVTMKSLEIKLQNCTSASEMKADLQRFMSELLTFLKPHLQPSTQSHDPCEWLSRVFMEQDDDMLEAAKVSLGLYLKLTRECEATTRSTQEKEMLVHHTHENGYNPHCIFLFFIKNIGFDSTVLLDFLISSETCFLEYFVRYLKLLQKDWVDFFTICKFFDAAESPGGTRIHGRGPSPLQDGSTRPVAPRAPAPEGHVSAHTRVSWASDSSGPPSKVVTDEGTHVTRNHSLPAPWASQSLVDYDSSDDSEEETVDQRLANSKQTSLHQEAIREIQDPAGTNPDKENRLEFPSRPLLPKESSTPFSTQCEIDSSNTFSETRMFYRTVKCFEELQGAIYRLQKKSLFPYNPAALLKLLKRIEAMYNKNVSPL